MPAHWHKGFPGLWYWAVHFIPPHLLLPVCIGGPGLDATGYVMWTNPASIGMGFLMVEKGVFKTTVS